MNRDPKGRTRPAGPNAHNPTALQPPPPNRSPMREETPSARAVGGHYPCHSTITFTLRVGLLENKSSLPSESRTFCPHFLCFCLSPFSTPKLCKYRELEVVDGRAGWENALARPDPK